MDIEVARGEFTRWRTVEPAPAPLAEGQARLRVDQFGFSSNNVSYAVIGDMLRYWDFFPASPPDGGDDTSWGRVPVWGFADVVETRSDDVVVGERMFGFLPMSTELVVTVARPNPSSITDGSPHRADLAGPYNSYRRCAVDPAYRPDNEELQMLLYPLFFTSFVIDDFLSDNGDFGAEQIVIASASAKTALGAAYLVHARGLRTVALTSTANAEFCRSLGVYDVVITYDGVDSLDQVPSVFIDVSGDQGIVTSVHHRLGAQLQHSMIVGDTHWDSAPAADQGALPGPAPAFLFAPSQITKRSRDWGADVLEATMAEAWSRYSQWVEEWITLEHVTGPDGVIELFRTYLAGRVDPRTGTICTLNTEESPS